MEFWEWETARMRETASGSVHTQLDFKTCPLLCSSSPPPPLPPPLPPPPPPSSSSSSPSTIFQVLSFYSTPMSLCDVTILVSPQAMHEIIRRTFQRQYTESHPRLLFSWTWRRVDCHKFAEVSEERTASILNGVSGGSTIVHDVDTFQTNYSTSSKPRRRAKWHEATISEWSQISKRSSALLMKICLVFRSTSNEIK